MWLSQEKAWQLDPDEKPLPSVGPDGILKCPRQIAIVSTGLIFHMTEERAHLASRSFGLVILDEAHRSRGSRGLGGQDRTPNNLRLPPVSTALSWRMQSSSLPRS